MHLPLPHELPVELCKDKSLWFQCLSAQRSPLCHLKDLKYYSWKKKNNNQTTENQMTALFRCHALGTMSLTVILLGSKCA